MRQPRPMKIDIQVDRMAPDKESEFQDALAAFLEALVRHQIEKIRQVATPVEVEGPQNA